MFFEAIFHPCYEHFVIGILSFFRVLTTNFYNQPCRPKVQTIASVPMCSETTTRSGRWTTARASRSRTVSASTSMSTRSSSPTTDRSPNTWERTGRSSTSRWKLTSLQHPLCHPSSSELPVYVSMMIMIFRNTTY